MVYCINHLCTKRHNSDEVENCTACGTPLLINNRIRLLRPLRTLEKEIESNTEVFEVEDIAPVWGKKPRIRVIKILKWNEPKYVELMRREVKVLTNLAHPCIPKAAVSDYFTYTLPNPPIQLHCLVMEKIEGENLEQWVETYGKISQNIALDWMLQLLEIVEHVHRTGYFHRDIKPTNIIHQPDGRLALVDYGAVRGITQTYLVKVAASGQDAITGGGSGHEITAIGSVGYSAPEQINGQALPQSDFYAIGRTFVYLLTGIPILDLPTDRITGRIKWRHKATQVSKPVADFIDELINPFPGLRPQTTEVIRQRIEKLPWDSKVHEILKSKVFKVSKSVVIVLAIAGCGFLSRPVIANYFISQGEKLERANDTPNAEGNFDIARKIYPPSNISIARFYFDKGSRNLDNPGLAKKYYELAVKYNNKEASAYNNLAAMCQLLGDVKCVKSSFERQFTLEPNNWEGHYGLGNFYESQSQYDLAQKEYQTAIQKSEQAIPAIAALARLKNRSKDYNTAADLATRGLKKTQNQELQASLYKDLGWAMFQQNKLNQAQQYLEKATNLDTERTDAFCLLYQVEEAMNKRDDARTSLEVCMLGKSSLPEVFMWRQELLERILNR
ncbi:TPR repeat-containing serine/threonine protein kinase (plasmid) [Nostoc sp. NIES-2111]|nr:TPR repeat-containing serine/threonine protein kinase [Nostoc sp. NIES-2111]